VSAVWMVCTALAAAVVLGGAPSVAGAPPGKPAGELATELRNLYQQTGKAARQCRTADRKLEKQRADVAKLNRQLSDVRARLASSRVDAGRVARQQYRNSTAGLTPYLRLALSRDPYKVLSRGYLLSRISADQALTVRGLTDGQRRLERTADKARDALKRQRELVAERKRKRATLARKRERVAKLLARAAMSGASPAPSRPEDPPDGAGGRQPATTGKRSSQPARAGRCGPGVRVCEVRSAPSPAARGQDVP
jgi:peptidoglycan DL-endopeptidase CwlO